MEFMGLVRHEPNRGFFIEQITPQEVKEVYDFGQDLIFSRPQESAGLEHQAILDAVAARDVSAARKAMRRHIRNIRNNALEGMQNRLAEADQIDF